MSKNEPNQSYYAKRHTQNLVSIVLLSITALLTITLSAVLLFRNVSLKRREAQAEEALQQYVEQEIYPAGQVDEMTALAREEGEQSVLSRVRSALERGEGTNNMIRSLFPDNLIVTDEGRYYFFDLSTLLKRHPFADDDFGRDDNGFLHLYGNGISETGIPGIDVSHHQGEIDWEKVADAGIEFAFIRVGARGSAEGGIIEDTQFEANIEGAQQNGIKTGVYFYTQAVNEEEALEEALFVLDRIAGYNIDYPVVFDIEHAESESARTRQVSKEQHTLNARAFCERIRAAGYRPMIYGNIKTFTLLLNAEDLMEFDTWIAYYNLPQYYPYDFTFWQYSSTGRIDGIDSNVDLNIQVKDLSTNDYLR